MSRRDQIRMTDDEVRAYLDEGRATLNVATINHDGTIHLVAMWFAVDDGDLVFWTYGKSQKIRNLQRDPRITCLIETGEEYADLRGVEVVGTGEVVTDRDEVMRIGFLIADRFQGPLTEEAKPFVEQMGAKRFVVRVKAERIVSWDHRKLGGVY